MDKEEKIRRIAQMKSAFAKAGIEVTEKIISNVIDMEDCGNCGNNGCRDGCSSGCLSSCSSGNK